MWKRLSSISCANGGLGRRKVHRPADCSGNVAAGPRHFQTTPSPVFLRVPFFMNRYGGGGGGGGRGGRASAASNSGSSADNNSRNTSSPIHNDHRQSNGSNRDSGLLYGGEGGQYHHNHNHHQQEQPSQQQQHHHHHHNHHQSSSGRDEQQWHTGTSQLPGFARNGDGGCNGAGGGVDGGDDRERKGHGYGTSRDGRCESSVIFSCHFNRTAPIVSAPRTCPKKKRKKNDLSKWTHTLACLTLRCAEVQLEPQLARAEWVGCRNSSIFSRRHRQKRPRSPVCVSRMLSPSITFSPALARSDISTGPSAQKVVPCRRNINLSPSHFRWRWWRWTPSPCVRQPYRISSVTQGTFAFDLGRGQQFPFVLTPAEGRLSV